MCLLLMSCTEDSYCPCLNKNENRSEKPTNVVITHKHDTHCTTEDAVADASRYPWVHDGGVLVHVCVLWRYDPELHTVHVPVADELH